MSVLAVSGVSKRYGDRTVLDGVSLSFEAGRVCAIVGASGCGKSTLLKLCNGLLRPDEGEVRAFAAPVDYADLPSLRLRMGYAVQGTGLFPHLSARENMALAAQLSGWEAMAISERLRELLALTHLEESLLDRYPHQLSGGQQQRVGLCRAMMLRPEILLLDEPFAAIDPLTRYDIHEQLLEILEAEPATVVLVTHDMREAMKLADRIVVMHAGTVRRDESRDALIGARSPIEPEALLRELMGPTQP